MASGEPWPGSHGTSATARPGPGQGDAPQGKDPQWVTGPPKGGLMPGWTTSKAPQLTAFSDSKPAGPSQAGTGGIACSRWSEQTHCLVGPGRGGHVFQAVHISRKRRAVEPGLWRAEGEESCCEGQHGASLAPGRACGALLSSSPPAWLVHLPQPGPVQIMDWHIVP